MGWLGGSEGTRASSVPFWTLLSLMIVWFYLAIILIYDLKNNKCPQVPLFEKPCFWTAGSALQVCRSLVPRKPQMSGLAEQQEWLAGDWADSLNVPADKALEPVNALKQLLPLTVSDPAFLLFPFALPYNATCPVDINWPLTLCPSLTIHSPSAKGLQIFVGSLTLRHPPH